MSSLSTRSPWRRCPEFGVARSASFPCGTTGQDDKILAVHIDDPQFAHYRDIGELPPHVLSELKRFFLAYKVLEDKDVSIEALRGHEAAERVILAAVRLYAEKVAELR